MFEYHGWATLRSAPPAELIREIEALHDLGGMAAHLEVLNGAWMLSIMGLRNHRNPDVIDLYHSLAAHDPDAYGLLYVWDQEDRREGGAYTNRFRVWRLVRGKLVELDDSFLSPCIPTLEDPYQP